MMPWCTSVEIELITVASCPPPGEEVDTNTDAYLPKSEPCAQSWPVASQNAFHCPGKLP